MALLGLKKRTSQSVFRLGRPSFYSLPTSLGAHTPIGDANSFAPPLHRRMHLHRQAKELDKPNRILAIVFRAHREAGEIVLIQRIGRKSRCDSGAASLTVLVSRCRSSLPALYRQIRRATLRAQRMEPLSSNKPGRHTFNRHLLLEVQRVSRSDGQVLGAAVRAVYKIVPPGVSVPARGDFMPTRRFLDQVGLSDSMFAADFIEQRDEVVPLHPLAVDGNGHTRLERHIHIFRAIGPPCPTGTLMTQRSSRGSLAGSSRSAPSWEICQRLRARE